MDPLKYYEILNNIKSKMIFSKKIDAKPTYKTIQLQPEKNQSFLTKIGGKEYPKSEYILVFGL